jgi:hypothetical protein
MDSQLLSNSCIGLFLAAHCISQESCTRIPISVSVSREPVLADIVYYQYVSASVLIVSDFHLVSTESLFIFLSEDIPGIFTALIPLHRLRDLFSVFHHFSCINNSYPCSSPFWSFFSRNSFSISHFSLSLFYGTGIWTHGLHLAPLHQHFFCDCFFFSR